MNAKILAFGLCVLALPFAGACAHNDPWVVRTTALAEQQGASVRVKIAEVYAQGGHLWVRSEVINGTSQAVIVDRDGIGLTLPNGRRIARRQSFGKTTIGIAPGQIAAVNFDFEENGIEWTHIPHATIDFSRAMTFAAGGAPIEGPYIDVEPIGH